MLIQNIALFLFLWFSFTSADVSISKPLQGQSFAASGGSVDIEVSWIESQAVPQLDEIQSYTFVLCTGPNVAVDSVVTLKKFDASEVQDNSVSLSIESTVGASGLYYIQVFAENPKGYTIHYTYRFNLTGMTGTYRPIAGELATPPSAQTSLIGTGQTIISIDTKSFTVPYTLQTGVARFAPMQLQPGASVTKAATQWTRQFPTSAVSYFSTLRTDLLKQDTTITQGWSYIISSQANWASPALYPSDNGGWYNPADRILTPMIMAPAATGIGSETSAVATSTTVTSSAE
jgi:hypothetical protein